MMDFTKTCWYCGRNAMHAVDGFYACESCGATWNEVYKLGPPIVKPGSVTLLLESGEVTVGGYQPTRIVTARARKARQAGKKKLVGVGKRIKKRRKKDARVL